MKTKICYVLALLLFLIGCSKNNDSPGPAHYDLHQLVGKEWWQCDTLGNPNTDFMRFQFLTDSTGNWIHLVYWTRWAKTYDTTAFTYSLIPPDTLRMKSIGTFQLVSVEPAQWQAYLLPRSQYPNVATFKPIAP
jgi:hypothetical protein